MRAAWAEARIGLRARRRRAVLAGLGIGLAATMLAAAVVVTVGLGGGFDRAARAADLPDVIAHFDALPAAQVASRIAALPDLDAYSMRMEITNVPLEANGHFSPRAVVELLDPGRRGYAIVSGRDIGTAPGEILVEQALASAWGIRAGSTIDLGEVGPQRVVGLSKAPDNVGFPLAAPRIYMPRAALRGLFGGVYEHNVNTVALWLRDKRGLATTLVQARSEAYGLRGLRLVTRSGVREILDEAAGIVIALLVALSTIALITAGVMLAAASRAEVERRLTGIGVRRALGAGRDWLALTAALEAAIVAVPAAAIGVLVGVLVATSPVARLLDLLNEVPPGPGIVAPLIGAFAIAVGVAVLTSVWPAWRAAGRSPVSLLAAADVSAPRRTAGRGRAGLVRLGARLVAARRARLAATLVVLGVSAAFILLLLALAAELGVLRSDPGALGRRYSLLAALPATRTAEVSRIPGVAAVAPRYAVTALDSFSLGETIAVVAYPGDHTTFEAPQLVTGRRLRGADEAEVGAGLARALGLSVGSTLALQLPGGAERRLRVAGIVSSLDHDGRTAFIPAAALLAVDPTASEQIAVVLAPGASAASVSRQLSASGTQASAAASAVGRGAPLVGALSAILRAIAVIDGFVCLYALVQALALTAQERRGAIAVLRACGGGAGSIVRLLGGAAAAVVVPAVALGIIVERAVLGPVVSHIAAGYADLPLQADASAVITLLVGLTAVAAAAVGWVARQATRGPVFKGSV